MLRKAREKAKEGLRSVNAETKRYLHRHSQHTGGHGRPRQPTNPAGAASISFKGVNFEAILDDEYDFTNQFDQVDQVDELEASSSSVEGHVASHFISSAVNINSDSQTGTKDQCDSDLFTDPLFPESEHELPDGDVPAVDDIDPLLGTSAEDRPQVIPAILVGDDHSEGESPAFDIIDTITIPKPEHLLLSESDNSVSPSSDNAILNQGVDDTLVASLIAHEREPLRSDSPLFNDDPIAGTTDHKKDNTNDDEHLHVSIFITQPSDECPHGLPQHMEISEEELFREDRAQPMEDDSSLGFPNLPDIEELERKLAFKTVGGQDLFSSEDSMFSSLASSYEGEKGDEIPQIAAATFPPVDSMESKSGHDESELFSEVVSVVEREVSGNSMGDQKISDSERQKAAHSNEEELELLLTPKQKPSRVTNVSPSDVSSLHSAVQVVDDPLHSSQVVEPRMERTGSHLDSGVFEQSMQKSTPERQTESEISGDDLFIIDEDHFKDKDDSTPVPVRRPFTKGSSGVEVYPSKKVLNSSLSAPIILPSRAHGDSKTTFSPPKKTNSGKAVPPPRPAMSPKLRHRITQLKQQSDSSSAGTQQQLEDMIATKKMVEPLGRAPPSRDVNDNSPVKLESRDTTSRNSETVPKITPNGSNTSPSPSKNDKRRIPADDLFLEDGLVSSSVIDKGTDKLQATVATPQPSEEPDVEGESDTAEDDETEYCFLYHVLFALCLYFYYSLNIFPYLSGFFAGFFVLYLTVGSVFIFYVQTVEKYQGGDDSEDRLQEPSREFTENMHVDFENLSVYKVSVIPCILYITLKMIMCTYTMKTMNNIICTY